MEIIAAIFRVATVVWILVSFGGSFVVIREIMRSRGADPLFWSAETAGNTIAFVVIWLITSCVLAGGGYIFGKVIYNQLDDQR